MWNTSLLSSNGSRRYTERSWSLWWQNFLMHPIIILMNVWMRSNWKNMPLIRHSCVLGDYFCNTSHQPFKRLHSVWERNWCRESVWKNGGKKSSMCIFFRLKFLLSCISAKHIWCLFEILEEATDEARHESPRTLMFADDTVICRGAGAV